MNMEISENKNGVKCKNEKASSKMKMARPRGKKIESPHPPIFTVLTHTVKGKRLGAKRATPSLGVSEITRLVPF